MKKRTILFTLLTAVALSAQAKVRLPNIIGDNMVLQQQTEARLWGWTKPGQTVRVATSWNDEAVSAKADKDGKWLVKVKTPEASYTPLSITFDDGEKLTINNVLSGEVWVCAGQSNMEMPVKGFGMCPVKDYNQHVLDAVNSKGVRSVKIPSIMRATPQDDAQCEWRQCSPKTVPEFSATGYFFARLLSRTLDIPVGIIEANKGGSRVESWLTKENLEKYTSDPTDSVEICKSSRYVDLVNASTRLMYYRWMGDHEIFSVDSSITARDVVRSLLEVTGCFLHIDRYGKPAFKYCTKSGLYPANDLYPADDLYPRGLDGSTLSLDGYISAETEDYSVKDIGRIQIVKQQINNENSVVEWEYIGDASMQNTYLIDDNIFYCNESMEYEYGSMQDVADMLENMYNRISNMGYMPGKFIITGMPWLEVGDRIGLLTFAGGVETFVFRRTYRGIIAPKDTIVSQGDEYIEAIKDYGYIVS